MGGERRDQRAAAGVRTRAVGGAVPGAARAAGFSLIELVAVVALIGIALAVVSLSFSKSLGGAQVEAASRDLVAALRYTRGRAIVRGEQQALDIDVANNTYRAPDRPLVRLPKDMRLTLTTAETEQTAATSGRIRFFPDGASTGGHIAVLLGRREWRINVNWLTGEVERKEVRQ